MTEDNNKYMFIIRKDIHCDYEFINKKYEKDTGVLLLKRIDNNTYEEIITCEQFTRVSPIKSIDKESNIHYINDIFYNDNTGLFFIFDGHNYPLKTPLEIVLKSYDGDKYINYHKELMNKDKEMIANYHMLTLRKRSNNEKRNN